MPHNTREWETEFIKLVTGTTPDKAAVPPQWIDFFHQELQKAREEERERIKQIVIKAGRTTEPEWIVQDILEELDQSELDQPTV